VVSGLKRLLKLSARITACRTSSSSVINFSLPAEDMLRRSKKPTGDVDGSSVQVESLTT